MINKNNKNRLIIMIILKLVFISVFSSQFQNVYYIPFVEHFIENFDNPWQYYYSNNIDMFFPFPPAMLYILSIFIGVSNFLHINNLILQNIFFKAPLILADVGMLFILLKLLKNKEQKIMLFYFFNPIIIYSTYINAELDIIAISILFYGIYLLLKDKYLIGSVCFGVACGIKIPSIVALGLIFPYLWKKDNDIKKIFQMLAIILLVTILFWGPFVFSKGYQVLVLNNQGQEKLYEFVYNLGDLSIYLAPLALFMVYSRFLAYSKINKDLLFNFLGLVYSIFVLLVEPRSNWYIWMTVFSCVLLILFYEKHRKIIYLYILMSSMYLIYFGLFSKNNLIKLAWSKNYINFRIENVFYRNLVFTILEGVILIFIYTLYKYGIRRNKIYKKKNKSIIIGIGGDSGAGKTTLRKAILSLLGEKNITSIEADGDHKWERGDKNWKQFTHLNPKANYLYKQANYLRELKIGNTIKRVEYDHSTGKFTKPIEVESRDYILVAGLHPFYLPQTRRIMDIKIYLDTDEKLRRHWKIVRDTKKRGYTIEKILDQIESRMEDAKKYIYPQKQFSNCIIRYFIDEEFKIGNENYNPKIKLAIKVSAELDLDGIIEDLYKHGIYVMHEFDEDLKYQTIILDKPIDTEIIKQIINNRVENIEEILDENELVWQEGYNSFIQMVLLMIIVSKMKGTEDYEL